MCNVLNNIYLGILQKNLNPYTCLDYAYYKISCFGSHFESEEGTKL